MSKYNLDNFYLKGGRKHTIDKYFNGIEYSTPEFNEKVLKLWKEDIDKKRDRLIWSIIVPITISVVFGIISLFI